MHRTTRASEMHRRCTAVAPRMHRGRTANAPCYEQLSSEPGATRRLTRQSGPACAANEPGASPVLPCQMHRTAVASRPYQPTHRTTLTSISIEPARAPHHAYFELNRTHRPPPTTPHADKLRRAQANRIGSGPPRICAGSRGRARIDRVPQPPQRMRPCAPYPACCANELRHARLANAPWPPHIDDEPSVSGSLGTRRLSESLRLRAAQGPMCSTQNQARCENEPYNGRVALNSSGITRTVQPCAIQLAAETVPYPTRRKYELYRAPSRIVLAANTSLVRLAAHARSIRCAVRKRAGER